MWGAVGGGGGGGGRVTTVRERWEIGDGNINRQTLKKRTVVTQSHQCRSGLGRKEQTRGWIGMRGDRNKRFMESDNCLLGGEGGCIRQVQGLVLLLPLPGCSPRSHRKMWNNRTYRNNIYQFSKRQHTLRT